MEHYNHEKRVVYLQNHVTTPVCSRSHGVHIDTSVRKKTCAVEALPSTNGTKQRDRINEPVSDNSD